MAVSVAKLRKLCDDQQYEKVFRFLTRYQNRVAETNVDRAAVMADVPYKTTFDLFKELENLSIGEVKIGRHQRKTRILWKYSPIDVGSVALGRKKVLEKYEAIQPEQDNNGEQFLGTAAEPASTHLGQPRRSLSEVVEQARRDLAERLGVAPETIEITIKI